MPHSILDLSASKTCTRCGQSKPLSEFVQRKSGPRAGRYEARCRMCMNEATALWRVRNPEIARQASRASYRVQAAKHAGDPAYREQRNAYHAAWSARNRRRIAGYAAARYARDPEHVKAIIERSQSKHPERRAARLAVQSAVLHGELPYVKVLACVRCGAPATDYHHWSYAPDQWLVVEAMCATCHARADVERRESETEQ